MNQDLRTYQEVRRRQMPFQMVRVDVVGQRPPLQRRQRQLRILAAEPRELARAAQYLARLVPVLEFTVRISGCASGLYSGFLYKVKGTFVVGHLLD